MAGPAILQLDRSAIHPVMKQIHTINTIEHGSTCTYFKYNTIYYPFSLIEFHKVLYIIPAPKEHRAPLVYARWHDIKDTLRTRSRDSTGLA